MALTETTTPAGETTRTPSLPPVETAPRRVRLDLWVAGALLGTALTVRLVMALAA